MSEETKKRLISETLLLLALEGPEQVSMRRIAEQTGIKQSVIYYYFPDKEALLEAAFMSAQMQIRQALMDLPRVRDARKMLKQRIEYHFKQAHLIVPMLRYFMAVKLAKPTSPGGHIPEQAYRHIKEPIELGIAQGLFASTDSDADARVIVHAVNGFILEHFPDKLTPKTRRELEQSMYHFIERALTSTGGTSME